MKRVLFSLLILTAPLAYGQTPTPTPSVQELIETVNILKGRVDDLTDARNAQDKRLSALQSKLDDLTAQVAKPSGNYATQDDIKSVRADIVAEDKKRQADNDDIIKTLKDLTKMSSGKSPTASLPHPTPHTDPVADVPANPPAATPDVPGFTYKVKSGETLVKISKRLYLEEHVKVSADDILKANPSLKGDAKNLKEDELLFIPAPKGTDTANAGK